MVEEIVKEWLFDYASLPSDELHSYASIVHQNTEVINALYIVLEDRQKYNKLVDPVCNTLFEFYRSREVKLKQFTLIFLPTLIYVYLNSVAHGEKKSCRGVEALLLGLYNLEAVDENCQAQNVSFRLPSLAQSSVYHEPMSLAPASLTESALRRLEECNTKLVKWGPFSQLEKILSQNRASVMTALLFIYNQHIGSLQKHCLDQLCKVTSKLVTQGFNKPGKRVSYSSESTRVLPRIPVSPKFLLVLLHSLYYSIFNADKALALVAVEDVYNRACYLGYAEVLLVTSAIKNSKPYMYSGHFTDNPMGISFDISSQTTPTVVSKSMITNASFRTKKLPGSSWRNISYLQKLEMLYEKIMNEDGEDVIQVLQRRSDNFFMSALSTYVENNDIPIQISRGADGDNALGSISEEKEETGNVAVKDKEGTQAGKEGGGGEAPSRRSLPKMAVSFGKKTRERLKTKTRLVNGGEDQQQPSDELDALGSGDEIIEQVRTMQVSSV